MQKQRSFAKRSRRPRHEAPKVWHNPDVVGAARTPSGRDQRSTEGGSSSPLGLDGRATVLGKGGPGSDRSSPAGVVGLSTSVRPQRIVALASAPVDPKTAERERLLARLAAAEGRTAITRAADAVVSAGFDLPADDQGVQLQLLEHTKDDHVEAAIERLSRILAGEPCKRQAVLESRLKRLEEFADEATLRDAARRLRRQVTGRTSEPQV